MVLTYAWRQARFGDSPAVIARVIADQAAVDPARLIPIALHSYLSQAGFTVQAFEEARFAPRLQLLK